ncbi:extracellular solute-binding protein [Yoonia sediminilitoris]|uniref:Microcin C transport system substrate-binding protein n=1 Tax=Yoonia sediminilitoris TaxID=1286148 RepID=A0A2T6KHB1_9RHOB|nr:extracellular solute-binding protein [Yoonia sediminilitoris]PUB14888.1 microcin C transport system substrate-binding protein [Yoonia sediminilitoris]RCW95605.1 microcin C transport system substrate-binding protein [Yoonia sediminilitoris]
MHLDIRASLICVTLATPVCADVTVSHGFSTFGDLKYGPDFPHFDYANPDAPQGGTMSQRQLYGTPTFNSLNAFIIKGDSAPEVTHHIYDSLMVRAYDEPDALYGLIAETITYPDDLSYVTFDMRPEARFHDGEPVTAADVVFTINALKTDGHPYYRNLLSDVQNITAETDHRVRFDLAPEAGSGVLGAIAELPVLPAHFYDDVPFDESWMTIPVGSGPYVVDTADAPRTITFCKDPDYWASDLPVNAGKNNFDCFNYEYFVDDTVGLEAFAAGEYLMRVEYRSASWATGYDFPAAQNGWVKQMMLPDGRPPSAQGIWFNMRQPALQDIRVREALEYAFNFEWTNETLFYGTYNRTDSFFENTEMEASGIPEGAELALLEPFRDDLPADVFTEPPHSPYAGAASPRDRAALRAASRLLDDAGWIAGDDGMRRNAAGELLSLSFPDDSRSLERVIVPFTENLKSLGIDINFEIIDPSSWSERRQTYDFDLSLTAWGVEVTPGAELRAFYGSASAAAEGGNNLSGVADPVVDALIEKVVAAPTRDDLVAAARALDRVLRSKHLWIGNWHLGAHRVAVWDVFDMPEQRAIYDFNRGVEFWWFDRDKYDALVAAGALTDRF